jgi:hypothetical protein
LVNPAGSPARDILDDDPPGPDLVDDAKILKPQSRAFSNKSLASSSARDVLTGESPADEIDSFEVVGPDIVDIFIPLCVRPVLSQDLSAPGVYLNLPSDTAGAGIL